MAQTRKSRTKKIVLWSVGSTIAVALIVVVLDVGFLALLALLMAILEPIVK